MTVQRKTILLFMYDFFFIFMSFSLFANNSITATEKAYIPLDMEYTKNHLIEESKRRYMDGYGKKWLQNIMSKGAPYREFIQDKCMEYNLPKSLEFLVVIESNYNTKAISKTGASGLWQFAENSIKGLLEKNEWIDERFDPWLSTEAAMKKLKSNYDYFGSWELALGAYNMGLGGMSRAIKKAESNDFWYLAENGYLSTQTKTYVPRFFAIAELITNYEFYGFSFTQPGKEESIHYSLLPLNRQIDLEKLSEDTGIDLSIYQYLNPSLFYTLTPPKELFTLRIPKGCETLVSFALTNQKYTQAGILHTIKKGDTLWALSKKYALSVDELCSANKINKNKILSIGDILFIPILE